MKKIVKYTYI